jgi:hypothetical protein
MCSSSETFTETRSGSPLYNSLFLSPSQLFSLGFLRARALSPSISLSLSLSLSSLFSLSFSERVHELGLCPSNRCSYWQHISNTLAKHSQDIGSRTWLVSEQPLELFIAFLHLRRLC